MHTRNCRNQAGRSFINLIGTTISEDPEQAELWNQLCRLQFPSKMIVVLWRILLNFLLVRAELRRPVRTFFLCVKDAETLDLIFFPYHIEKSGLV